MKVMIIIQESIYQILFHSCRTPKLLLTCLVLAYFSLLITKISYQKGQYFRHGPVCHYFSSLTSYPHSLLYPADRVVLRSPFSDLGFLFLLSSWLENSYSGYFFVIIGWKWITLLKVDAVKWVGHSAWSFSAVKCNVDLWEEAKMPISLMASPCFQSSRINNLD